MATPCLWNDNAERRNCLLGAVTILMTVVLREGSPTSCLLFEVFADELINLIKERCGMDGFLQWLHTLVLMEDSVISND